MSIENANSGVHPSKQFISTGLHGYEVVNSGLTKREYFAAMAMQGILANAAMMEVQVEKGNTQSDINAGIINDSLQLADEILKQLEDSCKK